MTPEVTQRYGTIVAAVAAAWLVAVVTASAFSLFSTVGNRPSIALLTAALLPMAGFVLWGTISPGFRQFALSIDPRILTALHTWRIAGVLFVVLASYGILPALFALPAGWGDTFIGITAPFVALYLANRAHRHAFVAWHVLGALDLIMAVTLGLSAPTLGYGAAMGPMTVLPLSIIPSFLVPALFLLHIASLAQAAGWAVRGGRMQF